MGVHWGDVYNNSSVIEIKTLALVGYVLYGKR